jgi:hypothetical protein
MTIIEQRFMDQVILIPNLLRELVREVSELNEQIVELRSEIAGRE